MVAYNFEKRFAPAIESGAKTNTIRKTGKRTHAKPGDSIQLYIGMRTKSCEKIVEDRVCLCRRAIVIKVAANFISSITLDGESVEDLDSFAVSDGFQDAADMHRFWLKFHGQGTFEGVFIQWGESNETDQRRKHSS